MARKNTATVNNTIVLTKKGYGAITLTQTKVGTVNYTVNGVSVEVTSEVANDLYKKYISNGFTVKPMIEKKVAAPKKPVTLAEQYRKNLAEINGKVKVEKKTSSPKKPTSNDKPITKTRAEALTEKYGDLDTRRAYAQKKSTIWNEEAAKIAEEVKKTGKRLRKADWKKLMNERVNARLSA